MRHSQNAQIILWVLILTFVSHTGYFDLASHGMLRSDWLINLTIVSCTMLIRSSQGRLIHAHSDRNITVVMMM